MPKICEEHKELSERVHTHDQTLYGVNGDNRGIAYIIERLGKIIEQHGREIDDIQKDQGLLRKIPSFIISFLLFVLTCLQIWSAIKPTS